MPTIKSKRAEQGRDPGPRARRAHAAALLIAVVASAAVLLAACGGASGGASTTASDGASGASQPTADSNQAAKFSQCMRAHGVPDFPDPNASGHFTLKVTKGGDLDPSSAAFKSAEQACKSLEPTGFGSGSSQSPQQQNQLLKFVSCMRSHGVPNFPDPSASGAMKIQGGANGVNPNSPAFKSAMQTCRSDLPNGGNGSSAQVGG